MTRVALLGTCNGSNWRNELIPMLECDYFNPVVEKWDDKAQKRELEERENCDFCLYVITPLMEGYYSIAEAVDDSNKRPEKTIFCVLDIDYDNVGTLRIFTKKRDKSLTAIGQMIARNGGLVLSNLEEVSWMLNDQCRGGDV